MGFAKLVIALEKVRQGGSARILHFGDSQIEGDRITGDLRDALQRVYGGEGPGMQPLVPFVPMAAVAHTAEGTWTRMVSFGRKNDKSPSNQYGPRGVSHRYSTKDGNGPDAVVRFSPRSYGYARARQARQFTLLHGPAQGPLEVKWFANDTLWKIEYLDSAARGGGIESRGHNTREIAAFGIQRQESGFLRSSHGRNPGHFGGQCGDARGGWLEL